MCINSYHDICIITIVTFTAIFVCMSRGSGAGWVVFGLVTPLDHPPEATQWVTAWAGGYYILYINRIKQVVSGGWSSGVTRPKTAVVAPILATTTKEQD